MTPAIRVEDLGKHYPLHRSLDAGYRTLRGELTEAATGWTRRLTGRAPRDGKTEFWALRGVSFDLYPGETLAVMGRNGAGKSTLLKILSRVVRPSHGKASYEGRLGSLLEVGAGFNPELTGRENIFLNGVLLGLSRSEVVRAFDQIIAFSEVGEFLDTPVKRYSSGMYTRLAFSVAAHLNPDILLVDEVLSVGDASFQKKSLDKVRSLVSGEGRTAVIVSHNLGIMNDLCDKGLCLEEGRVRSFGGVSEALESYRQQCGVASAADVHNWEGAAGDGHARLRRTWVRGLSPAGHFVSHAEIEIGAEVDVLSPTPNLIFGCRLFSEYDYELAYMLYDDHLPQPASPVSPGRIKARWVVPRDTLGKGRYRIGFALGVHQVRAIVVNGPGTLRFTLHGSPHFGARFPLSPRKGFTSLLRPRWSVSEGA
ncbi:MAG: polysaccharide ABC transporter ATP-binding protein [Planctomycetota bacterium]